MRGLVAFVILLLTITISSGAVVYYESNMATTEFEVLPPLEGKDCIYVLYVNGNINEHINVTNHANRPTKGELLVTITSDSAMNVKVSYWGSDYTFNGTGAISHTFDCKTYGVGVNTHPLKLEGDNQTVNVCWEVVPC